MPTVKIKLDGETFERLSKQALAERRPLDWQAEVLLRQSLGLPFPYSDDSQKTEHGEGQHAE